MPQVPGQETGLERGFTPLLRTNESHPWAPVGVAGFLAGSRRVIAEAPGVPWGPLLVPPVADHGLGAHPIPARGESGAAVLTNPTWPSPLRRPMAVRLHFALYLTSGFASSGQALFPKTGNEECDFEILTPTATWARAR